MHINTKRRKGFTLIEILVVVGIIMLLAAILFPVFARVRESGRRTSCLSNLKQLGSGMAIYMQDYDQCFPAIVVTTSNLKSQVSPSNPYGWADALLPYTKSVQIFQCPSEDKAPSPAGYGLPSDPTASGFTDYTINSELYYNSGNWKTSGIAKGDVIAPTQTIVLVEGRGNTAHIASNGCSYSNFNANTNYPMKEPIAYTDPKGCDSTAKKVRWSFADNDFINRHLGGSNFFFADGHAKWFKADGPIYNCYTPANDAEGGITFSAD